MLETDTSFQLISQKSSSSLYLDEQGKVLKLECNGHFDLPSIRHFLNAILKVMKESGSRRIMIDRSSDPSFSMEANEWMKEFLLTNRHNFRINLKRIAIVTNDTYKFNLYTNFMKSAFQIIFPGVQISAFEFEESAVEWLQ